jgi:hydroxymethylbilane synthase
MTAAQRFRRVRIGTRGSPLALWQARWVAAALQAQHPDVHTDTVVIRTTGDKNRRDPLSQFGTKGLFIKELEDALLRQDIDLAVHSMKDMPTELPSGLHLAVVPPRGEVRDAFVGRDGRSLTAHGGPRRIGTGSRRRQAQLLARYPRLQPQDIRGNVDTRLRKMRQGEVDGVVLAAVGLIRLGLEPQITEFLPLDVMLPAPGQGARGLETCRGHWVETLLAPLNHPPTANAVTAERAFLAHLGGGCTLPVAAFASQQEQTLRLQGLVSRPDGSQLLHQEADGSPHQAEALGRRLATQMLAQGAAALLATLEDG